MRRLFTVFIALWVCAIIHAQFGMVAAATQTEFSVDVLLDYGNGTRKWSTCILSKPGNDTVYNATQSAATTLNITWYGDDIFVDAINGVWNNWTSGYWWAVFAWNYSSSSWEALSVACNKHVLNENDMVAWFYDVHPWPPVPPPNPSVTQVDVLLAYGNGTAGWYENVNVIGVATVFKATQAVATLDYSWWGDDVFVDAINGVWNNYTTNYFWLYWYWNSTSGSWNCGPVACNKYLLNDGDVIAWYYETSPWGPPSATPYPVANFTWTPSIPKVGKSVTFDASASTPNGGTILKYEWEFGDGEYAVGKIVSHTYASPNTYTVSLNVSDSNGLQDIEQKQIHVVKPHGPKAEFTATPETARLGELIKFNASASLPGWNGTHIMPMTEYRWDFGDGNKMATFIPIVHHGFSSPGIYYVTLTVYALGATPETDTISWRVIIISVPVGGYSVPIKGYTTEKPLTPYLALVAILTAVFTTIRRKICRKE